MQNSYQQNSGTVLKPAKLWQRIVAWMAVIGIFVLALGIFTVSYAYKVFTSDPFVAYAPIDSSIYQQVQKSFWPWDKYDPSKFVYLNFFKKSNLDKLLPDTIHAAYILLNDGQEVWLFEFKQKSVPPYSFELPKDNEIDKNILIVASSPEALQLIRQTKQKEIFSLADQGLVPLRSSSFGRIFINPASVSQDLAGKSMIGKNIFITANLNNSKNWQLSIFSDNKKEKNDNLTDNLPKDFQIFLSGVDLRNFIAQVLLDNEELLNNFSQNQQRYAQIYNFDARAALDELLANDFDIIVFNNADNAFGLDFVMITKVFSEKATSDLEQLIKIMLAQKLPQKTLRLLPDGSSVTEILASTDAWQWESEGNIKFIDEPVLKFQLAYTALEDRFLMGSSVESVQKYLNDQSFSINHFKNSCDKDIFGANYIIFNKNNSISQISSYLPQGVTVLGVEKGCILVEN